MTTKHQVVILGGGFGGLYAAKALKKAAGQITVLDRRNFHLFQPLLYQVATGSLSPGEVASPLRRVLNNQQNTRVLMGEAVDLDAAGRLVILADGELKYDTLIVATGSTDSYFGHDDWKRSAPGLKTIEEATEIRSKILYAFEEAEKQHDPERQRAWLTFVIVGAGATGVELAGALGEIAHEILHRDFRSIDSRNAEILLLEGGPRVLPAYPADLSAKAEASLIRLGVTPRTNVMVTGIDEAGVTVKTSSGEDRIAARTVIWAAGVRASDFGEVLKQRAGAQLDRGGRVTVSGDLSVPGHPEIFVIGDLAHVEQDGKLLPGVAPVAMQQGGYVAKLIQKRLQGQAEGVAKFRYFDKGSLAVIGRASAVAEIRGLHLSGVLAWLTWLFVHLLYIVEFSNRVLVFIQWGFLYLTYNQGARLITGTDVGASKPISTETAAQR
ncbi:MAG TPA: NAD(P)/FAD-dependent oxidoreductase [Bryobacteraceae bacterium]|jgi:NADH dehydrogenase|nr:NAD(P)/FAD-dependent oxidoreductase [Bryobacteraceae bacterium]